MRRLARSAARARDGSRSVSGQPCYHGQPARHAGRGHVHRGRQQLLLVERAMEFHQLVPSRHVESTEACAAAPRRPGVQDRRQDGSPVRLRPVHYSTEFEYSPAPPNSGAEDLVFLEPPFYGMSGNQSTLSPLQGIPQETFSNPYPAATNPLNPILEEAPGRSLVWADRLSSGIRRICRNPTTTGSTSRSSMNCRARSSFRELISSIWGIGPTRKS